MSYGWRRRRWPRQRSSGERGSRGAGKFYASAPAMRLACTDAPEWWFQRPGLSRGVTAFEPPRLWGDGLPRFRSPRKASVPGAAGEIPWSERSGSQQRRPVRAAAASRERGGNRVPLRLDRRSSTHEKPAVRARGRHVVDFAFRSAAEIVSTISVVADSDSGCLKILNVER